MLVGYGRQIQVHAVLGGLRIPDRHENQRQRFQARIHGPGWIDDNLIRLGCIDDDMYGTSSHARQPGTLGRFQASDRLRRRPAASAHARLSSVAATIPRSGQPPARTAGVMPVRSGTRASRTARCHVPLLVRIEPSGEMIALSPVVEATAIARPVVIASMRAIASCWRLSPSWPSSSKSASLVWTASRLAPAVTSDRTRLSNPTS